MRLELPSELHYPFIIKRIDKGVGDQVKLRDQLFLYSYQGKVKQQVDRYDDEEVEVEKTLHAHFESPVEGTISKWLVWAGDTIRGPHVILEVEEECKHSVVFNGMCTECGKDITGFDERDTAVVQAAHDTDKLLISEEEATEVDEQAKKRLLAARKLSLVVDLDQTIIHAAVDPTIGEWQKDPTNPNYEALQDVRAFQLIDDVQGMRGCWYYIKLRPGLEAFLESIAEKYELHVYTMGTRQYAEQIAKIVDPDRRYFDDRVLSRDESGSMVAKSLARIFPVDTKMVVIIDDRGDVWKWSPNLIRVTAFDFFVGIGDINAGFLPKKQELQSTPVVETEKMNNNDNSTEHNGHPTSQDGTATTNGQTAEEKTTFTDTTALQQVIAMRSANTDNEEIAKTQEEAIVNQLEDKPLLKLQQKMDKHDGVEISPEIEPSTQVSDSDSTDSDTSSSGKGKRHSILRNDDEELVYLERSLNAVHDRFFHEYDRKRGSAKGGRLAALAGKRKEPVPETDESTLLQYVPDVKKIMPAMKQKVLDGITIVFSGVLPLGTDIQSADISIWAQSFGAHITDKVGRGVTHVIAARVGTAKVKTGVKRGIPVVSTHWLIQSMQKWKKQDERPFLLKGIGQKEIDAEPVNEAAERESSLLDDVRLGPQSDMLSSDEDTSALVDTTDDDTISRRKNLTLDLTVPAPDMIVDDDQVVPHSPIDINPDEWANMDDELRDFMGSDVDSESDAETVNSDRSALARRPRKRQHDEDESERDSESDGDDRNGDHKRPKISRQFGSALKAVHNVDSSTGTPPARPPDDLDEDEDDDEMARELEAALAED